MPTPWNDDPPGSEPQIASNAAALLRQLAADAATRALPTVSAAQDWHRRIYDGIALPVPYYAGEVRDSDSNLPELYGYEVAVGPFQGAPSQLVPQELAAFEANAQQAVAGLDNALPVGQKPNRPTQLQAVLTLCALVHGEWIRIHPFANGNGRTARIWANWAALRYAMPPFVAVKPRPAGDAYAVAALAGMRGQHQVAAGAFHQMLQQQLRDLHD